MNNDIVKFVKDACRKYGLSANYLQEKDLYMLHLRGMIVYAIYGPKFYNIPRGHRMAEILPILKVGLTNNLGEKYDHQVYTKRFGIKIV